MTKARENLSGPEGGILATTDPCAAGFFSKLWSGNVLVCSQQASLTASEQAQIQAVADSAAANYSPAVAAQTQTIADIQKAQASTDTSVITTDIANSSLGNIFGASCNGEPGLDLSIVGGPCLTYTLLKEIGLGLLLAVIVGFFLYGAAVLGPFIPKGRR
jgi:hypothetical protein